MSNLVLGNLGLLMFVDVVLFMEELFLQIPARLSEANEENGWMDGWLRIKVTHF